MFSLHSRGDVTTCEEATGDESVYKSCVMADEGNNLRDIGGGLKGESAAPIAAQEEDEEEEEASFHTPPLKQTTSPPLVEKNNQPPQTPSGVSASNHPVTSSKSMANLENGVSPDMASLQSPLATSRYGHTLTCNCALMGLLK